MYIYLKCKSNTFDFFFLLITTGRLYYRALPTYICILRWFPALFSNVVKITLMTTTVMGRKKVMFMFPDT